MLKVSQVLKFLVLTGFLISALFVGTASSAFAQLDYTTKARFAILMDSASKTVLFQSHADEAMEPASMAKLMTLAVVFSYLKTGRLELTDEFFISEKAWREGGASSGGSTMFAELNSKISVDNLIHSVIIQSGNDASIALAEGIAGSEETFALIMNETAEDIGLKNSHFTNATGLPDPAMYTTARDLALVANYIIQEYPQYYPIFSIPEFEWNGIKQSNRNVLLDDGIGVDGMKTGHTQSAGYGIVISTTEGGRRLVAVLHGLESSRERAEEARKLITWGSRAFEQVPAFEQGETIGYANVYGGEDAQVPLVAEGALRLYLPRGGRKCLAGKIVYQSPVMPPVLQGDELAELRIYCNDQLIQSAPLFAGNDVGEGSLVRKASDALKELLLGWL
ncbi:MAG TPA: D-alanyl-D-alanine carboxypeptidase [Devosia sp.]|nr:D-alanyl-D-alanine carboxypeptidase [Devosia sp.]